METLKATVTFDHTSNDNDYTSQLSNSRSPQRFQGSNGSGLTPQISMKSIKHLDTDFKSSKKEKNIDRYNRSKKKSLKHKEAFEEKLYDYLSNSPSNLNRSAA